MKHIDITWSEMKSLYAKLSIRELAFHKAALYFVCKDVNQKELSLETAILMEEIKGQENG